MKYGVFVGRFNPIHVGHEKVIDAMIKDVGIENCRLFIGSSGKEITIRNLFTYEQRVKFIRAIYLEINIAPLPDFPTDGEWLTALDDLLKCSSFNPNDVYFYGGCKEDVEFFFEDNRKVTILNRFDGSTPEISATKIRDFLIGGNPIEKWINPKICDQIKTEFTKNWNILRTR